MSETAVSGRFAHWCTMVGSVAVRAVDALPGSRRVIAWFACGSTATMSSARSGGPGRVDWQ